MVLSIDIGAYGVHLLYGTYKNGIVEVKNALSVKMPKDSQKKQSTRPRELQANLIRTGRSMSGLSTSQAIVTIKAENIIVRKLEVPGGKDSEVAAMVRDEMVHLYNASPTDVIEYKVLGESEGKVSVRAAAMGREIVDYYYSLLGDLKLKPLVLDTHMNAVSKLFAQHPDINGTRTRGKCVMLMDLGYDSIMAYIFPVSGEEISRNIPVGFSDLEGIIDAQVINIGAPGQSALSRFALDPGNEIFAQASDSFRAFFSGISIEITKLLRFYMYQGNQRPVDNIYLFGGGSNITGLSEYLTESVGISTERIGSVSNIKMADKAENIPLRDYINAAGAVIRL